MRAYAARNITEWLIRCPPVRDSLHEHADYYVYNMMCSAHTVVDLRMRGACYVLQEVARAGV